MDCFLAAAAGICFCDMAGAASTSRRALRGAKIPESEYTTLPNGQKYYDLKVGNGAEAVKGSRVAVRLWLSYIQFLTTWLQWMRHFVTHKNGSKTRMNLINTKITINKSGHPLFIAKEIGHD